jgi:UDP-3-O-[3-hydroxymyristoyl] glucosamine N-acyltransferase
MVHVAYNCIIGSKVIVCGQTGLAGSAKVGNYSMLSGHVGVAPGVELGEKTQVGGHSAVTGNLEGGQIYSGYPARPLREWLRAQATLRKLTKK